MSVVSRSIPLVDLRAQYRQIREEIRASIDGVLEGMELVLGPATQRFEQEFAAYCGTRHGMTVGNGTDALHLALRACGVSPGDEVITVSNTFVATVEAIELTGAQAVLVDIDPRIGTMDAGKVEVAIGPRTRAIVPVHLYGHPVDMTPILEIAARYQLRVVEDACQAHGAEYRGQRVGSLGDLGCFSFYCSKNLGAFGEGGAAITNDDGLAERVRLLRNHGSPEKYLHTTFGLNARLDEIQAAILQVKLQYLDRWNERRRQLAVQYSAGLNGLDLEVPVTADWARPVFHLYAVRTSRRDDLLEWLRARGIGAAVHYPIPIHRQPGYGHVRQGPGSLAVAERWARETLSLPLYPEMTEDDIEYVVAAVRTFFG